MVKLTPEQVEWADCEIGVLIHYDVQVFHPTGYQLGNVSAPVVFNPIKAVVFQGPKGTLSLARWVGNEQGKAPYLGWSTVGEFTGGEFPPPGNGSADGIV